MIRPFRPLFGRQDEAVRAAVPADVAIVRGRWLPALAGRIAGIGRHMAAVTVGDTIVVHPDVTLTPRLLRHELEHVRQWRERPVEFPLLYLWYHLRFGYDRNPFEIEARQAEQSVSEGSPP